MDLLILLHNNDFYKEKQKDKPKIAAETECEQEKKGKNEICVLE